MSFGNPTEGLSCGVTVNLNNLKIGAQTQIDTFINLNLGTPDGLQALANTLGGALSTLGSSIASVIPIPTIPQSLREDLAALAQLPLASLAAAGKILSIAEDYAEALGLRGFVDLNLNDLSKSVFSLGLDFDPCNPSIPNILKNPDGTLQKLPAIAPKLGETTLAPPVKLPFQEIPNNVQSALQNNTPIFSNQSLSALTSSLSSKSNNLATGLTGGLSTLQSQAPSMLAELQSQTPALLSELQAQAPAAMAQVQKEVASTKEALGKNVESAISGMGNTVRKLDSGMEVVEDKEFFIKRIQSLRLPLLREV